MSQIMSKVSAGYTLHGAFAIEDDPAMAGAMNALRLLHDRLHFRQHLIPTTHSPRYVRELLSGAKPMPLTLFATALSTVARLTGGRESVRRILAAIAAPFGLDVIERDEYPAKDVKSEIIEANEACSRAFTAVHDAITDRIVDESERANIDEKVKRAKKELDDLVKAVQR